MAYRAGGRLAALVLVALLALASARPPRAVAAPPPRQACFAATGACAAGAFFDYWAGSGGVAILGLPLAPVRPDPDGRLRQVYERAILEWHPENMPQFQVLLPRLGAARIADRPEARQPPAPCDAGCTPFPETGHTLREPFRDYWAAHGGLAVFGYPLTELFDEVNAADGRRYQVQYFERNRFEYHPEAPPAYRVQLGLLGREALSALGDAGAAGPVAESPTYGAADEPWGAVVLPRQAQAGTAVALILVGLDPDTRYTVAIAPFPPPGAPDPGNVATRVSATGAVGRLDLTFDTTGVAPGPYRIDVVWPDGRQRFAGDFAILAR